MATSGRRGRPYAFDREAALDKALHMFWEHGYEATSIADLTAAIGIAPPSLYAAFGSKHELFARVVERYGQRYRTYLAEAIRREPTLRAGIERLLREAAAAYTLPGHPAGCLIITATVNCATPDARELLRELRNGSLDQLERLVERAIAAGELPADCDAHALAVFTGVVMQGMAYQARDGSSRAVLEAAAGIAAAAWPWVEPE
ncbi:TetR/AcrR family transcriptional regulator [Nocardia sp. NPDC003482]